MIEGELSYLVAPKYFYNADFSLSRRYNGRVWNDCFCSSATCAIEAHLELERKDKEIALQRAKLAFNVPDAHVKPKQLLALIKDSKIWFCSTYFL